jgi:hypothetical protein
MKPYTPSCLLKLRNCFVGLFLMSLATAHAAPPA